MIEIALSPPFFPAHLRPAVPFAFPLLRTGWSRQNAAGRSRWLSTLERRDGDRGKRIVRCGRSCNCESAGTTGARKGTTISPGRSIREYHRETDTDHSNISDPSAELQSFRVLRYAPHHIVLHLALRRVHTVVIVDKTECTGAIKERRSITKLCGSRRSYGEPILISII